MSRNVIAVVFIAFFWQSYAGWGQAIAQLPENGKRDRLVYKPYSESEIAEAMQKPLKLEDCIRIALSKNLSLSIEKGNYHISEADLSGSYGKFYPVFSLDGSMRRTQENRPFDPTNPTGPTRSNFDKNAFVAQIQQNFITGASLSLKQEFRQDLNSPDRFGAPPTRTQNRIFSVEFRQPLLRGAWFTIARSPILLAQQKKWIRENYFLDVKLKTIFDTKSAYYAVLQQREIIKLNKAALRRDSTLFRLSESKLRANLATRRDVLSAEIRLSEDSAALIVSETDYQQALDELKDVMGVPVTLPIKLEEVQLSYSPEPLNEDLLIQNALVNNPLILSLETSIQNQRLQLKVAKNQLLPQLDLVVNYNGSNDLDTDLNKNINTKDLSLSLNLNYPFLDRSAAANAEKLQIALSQEETRLVNMKRQITLSIRKVVRNAYSSVQELSALKGSIEAAKQKVAFATTMFSLGRASNLDVTDAQEALLKAQTRYVRKIIDYHLQLALLETLIAQPIVY